MTYLCERLHGTVAVITGGASGIGEGIARRLFSEGARVVIADINIEGADQIAHGLGGRALVIECDASKQDQVAELMRRTLDRFGRIDTLCNNVGTGIFALTHQTDPREWLTVYRERPTADRHAHPDRLERRTAPR